MFKNHYGELIFKPKVCYVGMPASLWRYGVATFPQFGAAYHFGAQQIGLEYEVISSKLIASYQVHSRYLQTGLRLGSDNPNAKMAHALDLGAYLALGF